MKIFKHTDHLCPHHVITIEKTPDIKIRGKILYVEREMGICKITIDKDESGSGYYTQETIKIPEGNLTDNGWYIISWEFKMTKDVDNDDNLDYLRYIIGV